jgi:ubiquinone/menaquinone biosynthesis C-methylase UbiE
MPGPHELPPPGSAAPLCEPVTLAPLRYVRADVHSGWQLESPSGRRYEIRDGIPIFVRSTALTGLTLWQQRYYDRLAPWYDLGSAIHLLVSRSARRWRDEYFAWLAVEDGMKVLEVSVGTGANLVRLTRTEYCGIDLSWGMLARCRKKARGRPVRLCQALAEQLPFESNAFDVVFQVGAMNHAIDRGQVLDEMVRVARPGGRLLVVDASAKFAVRYRHNPVLRALYRRLPAAPEPPTADLPPGVTDVRVDAIAAGELYCLTFAKAG